VQKLHVVAEGLAQLLDADERTKVELVDWPLDDDWTGAFSHGVARIDTRSVEGEQGARGQFSALIDPSFGRMVRHAAAFHLSWCLTSRWLARMERRHQDL
jgi:hypothetical protein